jgi:hypothetical protein
LPAPKTVFVSFAFFTSEHTTFENIEACVDFEITPKAGDEDAVGLFEGRMHDATEMKVNRDGGCAVLHGKAPPTQGTCVRAHLSEGTDDPLTARLADLWATTTYYSPPALRQGKEKSVCLERHGEWHVGSEGRK